MSQQMYTLSPADALLNEMRALDERMRQGMSSVHTLMQICMAADGVILLALFTVWEYAPQAALEIKWLLIIGAILAAISPLLIFTSIGYRGRELEYLDTVRRSFIRASLDVTTAEEVVALVDQYLKTLRTIEREHGYHLRGQRRLLRLALLFMLLSVVILVWAFAWHVQYSFLSLAHNS